MIKDDWEYEEIKVGDIVKVLPHAWIRDDIMPQCLCPNCEYGEGYNETFIAASFEKKVLTCNKCGTEFIGIV